MLFFVMFFFYFLLHKRRLNFLIQIARLRSRWYSCNEESSHSDSENYSKIETPLTPWRQTFSVGKRVFWRAPLVCGWRPRACWADDEWRGSFSNADPSACTSCPGRTCASCPSGSGWWRSRHERSTCGPHGFKNQ